MIKEENLEFKLISKLDKSVDLIKTYSDSNILKSVLNKRGEKDLIIKFIWNLLINGIYIINNYDGEVWLQFYKT